MKIYVGRELFTETCPACGSIFIERSPQAAREWCENHTAEKHPSLAETIEETK